MSNVKCQKNKENKCQNFDIWILEFIWILTFGFWIYQIYLVFGFQHMEAPIKSREIERKFLVKKVPQDLHSYPHREIIQGYLAVTEDGVEVRLRKKGDRCYQAVKSDQGIEREETEIEFTRKQFESLWPLTQGRRIEKRRYEIEYQGVTIELDVYHGILSGLVTAEVEFESLSASDSFTPPEWFGTEITRDERFKNKNLALYGAPNKQSKGLAVN